MGEQCRKEFETWYKENINKDGPFMSCGKLMRSELAMFGLMCWEASRQMAVIELPGSYEYGGFQYLDESRVIEAIEAAGVKYK